MATDSVEFYRACFPGRERQFVVLKVARSVLRTDSEYHADPSSAWLLGNIINRPTSIFMFRGVASGMDVL